MAGGNSIRFGENKLLYEYNGKPLYKIVLENIINGFLKCPYDWNVIVVTQYNEIKNYIDTTYKNTNIYSVLSPKSCYGVSYTVKAGILSKYCNGEWYMFAVCDQPFMKSETYLRLFLETLNSKKGIGTLIYNNREGNPIVFNSVYKNELLSLEGDRGGRNVLKKHRDDVYYCEVYCEKELYDIDTKDFL